MRLNVSQNSAIKGKGTYPSICTYCTTSRKKCQADFAEKLYAGSFNHCILLIKPVILDFSACFQCVYASNSWSITI